LLHFTNGIFLFLSDKISSQEFLEIKFTQSQYKQLVPNKIMAVTPYERKTYVALAMWDPSNLMANKIYTDGKSNRKKTIDRTKKMPWVFTVPPYK